MTHSNLDTIAGALRGRQSDYAWETLLSDIMQAIMERPTRTAEHTLLELLGYDGQLSIDESQGVPHRMSPEDTLKSLAVQSLVKWTGLSYILPITTLRAATRSVQLKALIDDVLANVLNSRSRRIRVSQEIDIDDVIVTDGTWDSFKGSDASSFDSDEGVSMMWKAAAHTHPETTLTGKVVSRVRWQPLEDRDGMFFIPGGSPFLESDRDSQYIEAYAHGCV